VIVCEARRVPFLGGSEGWAAAPAWLRGLDVLDDRQIDVVASHELYSFSTRQAASLADRHGAVHLVHVSETMVRNPVYRVPPYRQLTRRAIRRTDWLVCTTERARQHAIELGCDPARASVVHSGVDTDRFRPAPDGLASDPHILFVGMLRADRGADKGVLDLVAAVERVQQSIPEVELTLVGDGHLRPQLERMAADRPHLSVSTRIPRDEIPRCMQRARVLSLASKRTWKWEEQFGFVLAEAMATGLPVVATRSGAIPEVVPPWNPLAAEGDVDGLAAGLIAALGPEGERWGRQNRSWVEEHFDLRRQSGRLRDVIDAAIAAGRRQR
jgi:glycosyltransferase involved in cell wall biosynthesis